MGPADTDGDGLPDDWERFYFGNLSEDSNGDPDHDGATNQEEWAAKTDPTASSRLRILQAGFDVDGNARLRFTLAPVAPMSCKPAPGWVTGMPPRANWTHRNPASPNSTSKSSRAPPPHPPDFTASSLLPRSPDAGPGRVTVLQM